MCRHSTRPTAKSQKGYVVAATKLPIKELIYFGISSNMKQNIKNEVVLPDENLVWSSRHCSLVSENTSLLCSPWTEPLHKNSNIPATVFAPFASQNVTHLLPLLLHMLHLSCAKLFYAFWFCRVCSLLSGSLHSLSHWLMKGRKLLFLSRPLTQVPGRGSPQSEFWAALLMSCLSRWLVMVRSCPFHSRLPRKHMERRGNLKHHQIQVVKPC